MIANDNAARLPWAFRHMREHASWWRRARLRLTWLPIDRYDDCACDLVIARSTDQWALASPQGDGWARHVEGGTYPLDGFEPIEFAVPTLDDLILLAQE